MNTKEIAKSLASMAKRDMGIISTKVTNPKKINDLIVLGLAQELGFKHIEVPSASDTVLRQYYMDNCQSFVDEVVSMINEEVIIDHAGVIKLTYDVWFFRAMLVRGALPSNVLFDVLEKSPTISGEVKELIDCREDIFKGI